MEQVTKMVGEMKIQMVNCEATTEGIEHPYGWELPDPWSWVLVDRHGKH